jgi:hypothetical protein
LNIKNKENKQTSLISICMGNIKCFSCLFFPFQIRLHLLEEMLCQFVCYHLYTLLESGRAPFIRAWDSRGFTRSFGPTKCAFREVGFPRIQKKKSIYIAWSFLEGIWEYNSGCFFKCFLLRNASKEYFFILKNYFWHQHIKMIRKHKKKFIWNKKNKKF